jgi:glycosyltransferase involved in cell wall biosynthesis
MQSMKSPKLSIIVPVYKSEKTIRACVESILNQTYRDVEAVVVDDGSPDRSREIVMEMAEQDERVRFFPAVHGGVSSARNYGIEHASGEWIAFLDSDDTLDIHCAERFIETIADDRVIYSILWPVNAVDAETPVLESGQTVTRKISQFAEPIRNGWQGYIGGKFFRRDILKAGNVRFRYGISYAEDTLFAMDYLLNCDPEGLAVLGNMKLYYYKISEGGLRLSNKKKTTHLQLLRDQLIRFGQKVDLSDGERKSLYGWWYARKLETELDVAEGLPTIGERWDAVAAAMKNKEGVAYLRTLPDRNGTYLRLLCTGDHVLYFVYAEIRLYKKKKAAEKETSAK